jgi:hypothetical protein
MQVINGGEEDRRNKIHIQVHPFFFKEQVFRKIEKRSPTTEHAIPLDVHNKHEESPYWAQW